MVNISQSKNVKCWCSFVYMMPRQVKKNYMLQLDKRNNDDEINEGVRVLGGCWGVCGC